MNEPPSQSVGSRQHTVGSSNVGSWRLASTTRAQRVADVRARAHSGSRPRPSWPTQTRYCLLPAGLCLLRRNLASACMWGSASSCRDCRPGPLVQPSGCNTAHSTGTTLPLADRPAPSRRQPPCQVGSASSGRYRRGMQHADPPARRWPCPAGPGSTCGQCSAQANTPIGLQQQIHPRPDQGGEFDRRKFRSRQ